MLKLFSKNNPLFSHVREIDPEQLPITTGFDFFDRFLASAVNVDEKDHINNWTMTRLDTDVLVSRYGFFGEILDASAEIRAQSFVLQQILPSPDLQYLRANRKVDFAFSALRVLSDRLRQSDLAPVSEFLALEIIRELDDGIINQHFVDMLERSFLDGPSQALRKTLIGVIERCSETTNTETWDYISQLERLVVFTGCDPEQNQLIAEAKSVIDESRRKQEHLLGQIDPIFTYHYLAQEPEYDPSLTAKLRAESRKPLNARTPLERGRFVADMAVIRREIHLDPFWKKISRWKYRVPCFNPNNIEKFYRGYKDHQKNLNRKLELTSDQAYLILEDALGVHGYCSKLQARLSSPLVKTLVKYMEPGVRPDLVQQIEADRRMDKDIKERLLLALKGDGNHTSDPGVRFHEHIQNRREALDHALQKFPDLFFKFGNIFSVGTGLTGRDLSDIDHQAFPYFPEINDYVFAVAKASLQGIQLTKEADELKRFRTSIAHNLDRLAAGEGQLGNSIRSFIENEMLFRVNRERFPGKSGFGASAPATVSRDELIAFEKAMLAELDRWIGILSWYQNNAPFVRWMAEVAPSDTSSKPSSAWIKNANRSIIPDAVMDYLECLEPVPGSVPYSLSSDLSGLRARFEFETARFDKGVIWAAHLCDPDKAGPLLVDYIKRCFVTLPGVGIKAEKLGNAALWALQNMPDGKGVPYLAHILARNKYPKVRKKINAVLDAAAAEAGMSRAELNELTAPDHRMPDGLKRIAFSEGAAVLTCEGSKIQLSWEDNKGVGRKAPPKAIKDADPEGIRAAKALAKEVEQDLSTQALRLDGLYLKKLSWSFEDWRERYANHGTVAMLARRLIWKADLPDGSISILPSDLGCFDVDGKSVDCSRAKISLWHPINANEEEIHAWRERLLELGIQQPFKQVWREVYKLTDAERDTGTYSNRFAGHIIRQHQMMTLAQLNGWKCTHRMWVDAPNDEPSHIHLSDFNLYAEFWTEGAGGEDPPVLDSCAYIYLTTDRLKFCRLDAAARYGRGEDVELTHVPAIVFSEIMRHCDLFTSVPSISLDSEWMDLGSDAEHPNQWRREVADPYWQKGQIADLGTAAQMRRNVLAAILPRLKQSAAFALQERFLHVKGVRHEYAIHLGSGAVQLMPDARHICIVRAPVAAKRAIRLPFEGDQILSLILSKALMLAQDDKITDPVIQSQLA
ncbi:DUF4132 domain-containing protein [Roseibium sp.]|uniref:DUF4132 domain-containing protein n=1 Tax=Roseibium sp. TaxID=1936156 RepID=UPI003D0E0C06